MHEMVICGGYSPVGGKQQLQSGYNASMYHGGGVQMAYVPVSLQGRFSVLLGALRNTYKALKFSEEYAELLQEYISPEEYEAAMKEYPKRLGLYVREPREMTNEEIAVEAKQLLLLIGTELDSEELAEMMNADVFQVEDALREYSSVEVM